MTQFKKGDEVLVKAKFLCGRQDAIIAFDHEIDGYSTPCVKDLIPASALDVNKELLEAAKAAIAYCEEISTFGSKYGTLEGPIVSAAFRIARGLNEAIAAAEKGE